MTLVEELRECVGKYRAGVGEVCSRAADRIEELETENGELQEWRTALHGSLVEAEERAADRIHDLEAERAELLERIQELEKRFLARTSQAANSLQSTETPTQPSVTPESQKAKTKRDSLWFRGL